MELSKPFPWTDGDGLPVALLDTAFWSNVYRISTQRQFFKRVFKKLDLIPQSDRFSVGNDDDFGSALVATLASSARRQRAAQMLSDTFHVARGGSKKFPLAMLRQRMALDLQVYLKGVNGSPPVKEVCEDENPLRIEPTRFEKWLAENAPGKDVAPTVVRFACASALANPDLAPAIFDVLVRSSETLAAEARDEPPRRRVADEPTVAAPPQGDIPSATAEHGTAPPPVGPPAQEPSVARPEPPPEMPAVAPDTRPVPDARPAADTRPAADFVPASVAVLLREWSKWDVLPLGSLRPGLAALREAVKSQDERLAILEEQSARISMQLREIAAMPWWPRPVSLDAMARVREDESLQAAGARLSVLEAEVARVNNAHSIVSTLAERLERRPEHLGVRHDFTLAQVAAALESAAADLHAELERLALCAVRAQELIDRIVSQDPVRRLDEALRETADAEWLNLAEHLLRAKRPHAIPGRFDIAGAALALCWVTSPAEVTHLLEPLIQASRGTAEEVRLLSYFDFASLPQLADRCPPLRAQIAELLFISALVVNQPEALDYLEVVLPGLDAQLACIPLYRAFCTERHKSTLGSFRAHLVADEKESDDATAKEAAQSRRRLLDIVQHPPGMRGNFHRLRVIARAQFLAPLEPALSRGDIARAAADWRANGTIAEMVDVCVSESGHAHELEPVHLQQTSAYLEEFAREIERCERLHAPPQRTQLANALVDLRRDPRGRHDGSSSLLGRIDLIQRDAGSPILPPADFGRRTTSSASGEILVASPDVMVQPTMLFSWPLAVADGAVPLRSLIVDRVREAHGAAPGGVDEAARIYLRAGALLAARRAAKGDAAAEQHVEEAIAQRIEAIRGKHAELFGKAQEARAENEDIDQWLNEIETAFEALDLGTAGALIDDLENLVQEYERNADPVRRAHIEFLAEAGRTGIQRLPSETLAGLVEALRVEQQDRRLHVAELEAGARIELFSKAQREAWETLSRRIDRPRLWPKDDVSLSLSLAIQTFFKFMRGKLRYRHVEPDMVDLLVARLGEWIPERVLDVLQSDDVEAALKPILDVAREIEEDAPERQVLHLLGVAPTVFRPAPVAASPAEVGLRSDASSSAGISRAERRERPTVPPVDVIAGVRQFLQKWARSEQGLLEQPDPQELKKAILAREWRKARVYGAVVVRRDAESTEPHLSGGEAAYAVALTYAPPDPAALKEAHANACLAAILHNTDVGFYNLGKHLDAALPRALIRLVLGEDSPASGGALYDPSRMVAALAKLAESGPGDAAYNWTGDLFATALSVPGRDGAPGTARLAQKAWGALTGVVKDNAVPRRNLLHVLYRLRRFEALRYLAQTAKPADDLIVQCVTVFDRAEADPELRVPAQQIYLALCEQTRGRPNTRPWTQLFARIGPTTEEDGGAAVSCSLDDTIVSEESDGTVMLPIRLVPSLDLPDTLQIHIGGEEGEGAHTETYDDILVKETVVYARVQRAGLGSGGDTMEVPYRIAGRTIRGNRIDIRGSWTLQTARIAATQILHESELRRGWPGASGEPVTSAGDFHGRKREIAQIERYVLADDRQRSVMLFGQRRVGKTSLLCQMVMSLPPGEGRVAGAFLDVSGMAVGRTPMAKGFFDHVVVALENDTRNAAFRAKLSQHNISVSHLARGLAPATALAYALEGLVERMRRESRGAISRVALFIDEFDRFVEPLLADQRDEVDQLMWQVRQIVQRSETISLVLAGSGLQRLLVSDYVAPLFGSIDSIEIAPFDWDKDELAIQDTFLPPGLRDRVCAKGVFRDLVQEAYRLSGGHPYYLSMLGYSATMLAAGRPLTRASLNRTVEAMVNGTIRSSGPRIDAARFYAPIFESLMRLRPRVRAVAKLLLVQVAQRTTREYPWLSASDAAEGADLRGVDRGELLQAERALVDEGALEIEGKTGQPRVRIRVPLTASALRQDATILRQEGRQLLQSTERGAAP